MKKTLISLAIGAFAIAACNNPKYSIKGTVEGEQAGNVYLIRYNNDAMDTMAKASIENGKFTLEGSVNEMTGAMITLAGKRGGAPIFVENAEYTATLNPGDVMENKIEGTITQDIANQYMDIVNEMRKEQMALYKEYSVASQEKDEEKMQQIEERFNQLNEDAKVKEEALIKTYPDSYVSAYMLANKMGGMEAEEIEAQYALLGEKAKATEPGKQIAERIEKLSAVAIGQVAPDFTMNTPEGKPLSLHSIKGKVKIIDFWASWCRPCRGENPHVVKMYQEFHPKGLEILGVSLDNDQQDWLKAIEDDNLTWNHVSDLKGWQNEAAQLYVVNGIPHLVILDENNVIVAKNLRGEQLREKIAELLK